MGGSASWAEAVGAVSAAPPNETTRAVAESGRQIVVILRNDFTFCLLEHHGASNLDAPR